MFFAMISASVCYPDRGGGKKGAPLIMLMVARHLYSMIEYTHSCIQRIEALIEKKLLHISVIL